MLVHSGEFDGHKYEIHDTDNEVDTDKHAFIGFLDSDNGYCTGYACTVCLFHDDCHNGVSMLSMIAAASDLKHTHPEYFI